MSRRTEPVTEGGTTVVLSRTWELELFISGATVFALMRAPAMLDAWYARVDPHLDGGAGLAAYVAFYFGTLSLYTLISTFVLHLIARAYWVGLVGLHSVFPDGVRWDELKLGPAFQSTMRERVPTLEHAIRRMDDVSSVLFAGGALVLLLFLMAVVLFAFVAAVSLAVAHLLFGGRYAVVIGGVLLLMAMLLPAGARIVDQRLGRRNGRDAEPHRILLVLARLNHYVSFLALTGPFLLVLTSNLGRRRGALALQLVFFGIVGVFVVRDVLVGGGLLRADSHRHLPDDVAAQAAPAVYYADRRSPGVVYPLTPAIQSEIIREPYVRLFVPISAERHNRIIAERCPDVPELPAGVRLISPRAQRTVPDASIVLECLAALQPIHLDGRRISDPALRLTTDEQSGVRGVVAFIPVTDLAPGEHVLRVDALPRAESDRRPAEPPYLIRFWR